MENVFNESYEWMQRFHPELSVGDFVNGIKQIEKRLGRNIIDDASIQSLKETFGEKPTAFPEITDQMPIEEQMSVLQRKYKYCDSFVHILDSLHDHGTISTNEFDDSISLIERYATAYELRSYLDVTHYGLNRPAISQGFPISIEPDGSNVELLNNDMHYAHMVELSYGSNDNIHHLLCQNVDSIADYAGELSGSPGYIVGYVGKEYIQNGNHSCAVIFTGETTENDIEAALKDGLPSDVDLSIRHFPVMNRQIASAKKNKEEIKMLGNVEHSDVNEHLDETLAATKEKESYTSLEI